MNSKRRILLFLALWTITLTVSLGSARADGVGRDFYDYKIPSKDGTGKVYMDREISFILGHRGIEWLERPERAAESGDRVARTPRASRGGTSRSAG
jgi:hypothetical protein